MTSDLFHDVARAYYGVGPEVYTLANIATNGAAPPKYAMGCEPNVPQQYASDSLTSGDRNPNEGSFSHEDIAKHIHSEAADHSRMGKVLSNLAHASDDPDLHAAAMHYNTVASRYFRHLANPATHSNVADPYHIARIAKGVAEEMENRVAAHKTALDNPSALSHLFHEYMPKEPAPQRSTGPKGYVSPGLPAPPKQPKSMPGQKSLFTNDSQQSSDDTHEEKPDFSETGTGDHVTADEEDYGLGDAAKGIAKKIAIGGALAAGAMGGQAAGQEPASLQMAREYADPALRNDRMRILSTAANEIRQIGDKYKKPGVEAAGNRDNDLFFHRADTELQHQLENQPAVQPKPLTRSQRVSQFLQTPAGRQWVKAPTEIAKPASGTDDLTRLDPLDASAHSGGPISVETNYEQMRGIGKKGAKPSKPDFSETGTGDKVKVPESKNCAKSGCDKKVPKPKAKSKSK